MSWNNVVATGSGKIAMRLMVLGHPVEWCTDSRLVGSYSDGRVVVPGLNINGIQYGEKLDPVTCKLTQTGFTATIIDDYDSLTGNSLNMQPTKINYLAATITDTDTVIPTIGTNHDNGEVIYIGMECMLITAGGGTAAPTVTRNYRDTISTYHIVDSVTGMHMPEITNTKPFIEGQTAFLYAYGDGETGEGTQIWTGTVSMQPKLRDLRTWEIALDGVSSKLSQMLSADLEAPGTFRGIYYKVESAPSLRICLRSTGVVGSSIAKASTLIEFPAQFFETQTEWISYFNTYVAAEILSRWGAGILTGGALEAYVTAEGSWGIQYTTGISPQWIDIELIGSIDPYMSNYSRLMRDDATGAMLETLVASKVYKVNLATSDAGAGTVPRGFIGYDLSRSDRSWIVETSYYDLVYLGGTTAPTAGTDQLVIKWPADNTPGHVGRPEYTVTYSVTSYDVVNRVATIQSYDLDPRAVGRRYNRDTVPEISVVRNYVTNGHVGDLISSIVTGTPLNFPLGKQPYITINDVDYTTVQSNVAAHVAGIPWIASRNYIGKANITLEAFLTEEFKLCGMIPSIDSTGRLTVVEFRSGATTEDTAFTLNSNNNLSSNQLPGYEPSAYGLLNTVTLKLGWDPISDKHVGDTVTVRDMIAISRSPLPIIMKIEPRSNYAGTLITTRENIVTMAQVWLGVLGAPYATITIRCTLAAINVMVGQQIIGLTNSNLPNQTIGGRGITSLPTVCIGRIVNPIGGYVDLTLLATTLRIGGYAPSSNITSWSSLGGDYYDLVIDAIPTEGYAPITRWNVSDNISIVQYDTVAPSTTTGIITNIDISSNKITVYIIAGVPVGAVTIEYSDSDIVTDTQKVYSFYTSTDNSAIIVWVTGNSPPVQLSA